MCNVTGADLSGAVAAWARLVPTLCCWLWGGCMVVDEGALKTPAKRRLRNAIQWCVCSVVVWKGVVYFVAICVCVLLSYFCHCHCYYCYCS